MQRKSSGDAAEMQCRFAHRDDEVEEDEGSEELEGDEERDGRVA